MATTRRHPADEVPINGSSSRTWEDLISSHLDGIPAESGLTPTRMIPTMMQTSQQGGCEDLDLDLPTTPGSDDDGGRSERSTGKKPFLKKGSRAMRTSPLTPKTMPRTGEVKSKASSGRRQPTTPTPTRRAFSFGEETGTGAATKGSPGLFKRRDLNVSRDIDGVRDGDVVDAWRRYKSQSQADARAFEALESRVESELAAGAAAVESPRRDAFEVEVPRVSPKREVAHPSTPARESSAEVEAERLELSERRERLEAERREFEQEKASWSAHVKAMEREFKEECDAERRALKQERANLARETERRLALPTKEERNEAKFLREQLERNEQEFKVQQQKSKLTVDRLRQQIVDLNNEVSELRVEKRMLQEKLEVGSRMCAKASSPAQSTPPPSSGRFKEDSPIAQKTPATRTTPSSRDVGIDGEYAPARVLSIHDPAPSVNDKSRLLSSIGVVQEIEHDDGRIERFYGSGRRVVTFTNGTIKEMIPIGGGTEETVYFTNDDIKRTSPGGVVEYYYAEVETWHTTHPSGVELYHFVNTHQVELHGANDYREILFPDGTLRRVHPDGREEDFVSA